MATTSGGKGPEAIETARDEYKRAEAVAVARHVAD